MADVHWPQKLGPPQSPITWTKRVPVLYTQQYLQATPCQKHIQVKFPINCCVAWWPSCLGDVHWSQNLGGKQFLLNNHTSLDRLGSTALVGSQSRRRATLIRKPTSAKFAGQPLHVKIFGPWTCLSIQKPCPTHGSTPPCPICGLMTCVSKWCRRVLNERFVLMWSCVDGRRFNPITN